MDITPTIITTNATKSPETDSSDQHQTGASPIQSAKPLTFTNGVLKRQHHTQPQHRHHHHPIVVTYKECLKNHAASLGVHALDGCGEFMPSPTANPSDPTSLKCSACGCHRNFHRREPDQDHLGHAHTPTTATIEYQPLHRHHPPPPLTQPNPHVPPSQRSPNSASPPPISSSYYPPAPHALLALSGNLQQHSAAAANQEHGNINNNNNNNNNNIMMMSSSGGRKRFRTKFSQIQKEKMFEFAERVGWKMQRRDEDLVHEICNQVGVDRTVLKVWMHNNKNTFAKRDLINGGGGIGKINLDGGGNNNNNNSISISSKSGDGDEDDQINGVNNNSNNGLQNLNHQFESTATENVANLANANGGGSSSSS